jgi:hypothetical protein
MPHYVTIFITFGRTYVKIPSTCTCGYLDDIEEADCDIVSLSVLWERKVLMDLLVGRDCPNHNTKDHEKSQIQ